MAADIDVWEVLYQGRVISPAGKPAVAVAVVAKAKSKNGIVSDRLWWAALDAAGLLWWVYLTLHLFVMDVDRLIVGRIAPGMEWLLNYKFSLFVILAVTVALFFWRARTLGALLYIAFYPFVLLFWKLPKWLVANRIYENWLVVLAAINGVAALLGNLRYHVASKGLAILAAVVILSSVQQELLWGGGFVLLVVLFWATLRIVVQTFRANAFISTQKKVLETVNEALQKPMELSLRIEQDGTVTLQQAQQLATTIQNAALLNRALYFWAHKLQQYRESNMGFLINTVSYISFFVGAVCVLFLLNVAALKAIPTDFTYQNAPSLVGILLYSLSSLAFADGGGISAHGEIAYFLRIVGGLIGPTFALTVLLNAILFRGTRDDVELRKAVEEFRERARQHEQQFRQALSVSIDEACDRLVQLGYGGLISLVAWLRRSLPPDFLVEKSSGSSKNHL